ncbi:Thiol:disulfide interchange protein DsbC precursor [Vibrio thalassae]|uniref:Thiol:disulfide interchange protein DsbC n=1 Tax=Vibrio thalassae TaxID=1243014 RepID=A0A240EH15_9VIBR|nr:thioredoxin fold domain-containing protein [Vibrio thalassae]SNX47240.1 Thiol:disulfide interchange protein DsbC precursor [Vibrio thalassae]
MVRGVISSFLLASLNISMPTIASEAENFLRAQDFRVISRSQEKKLDNISLETIVTEQGIIYMDAAKGVFFTATKPLEIKDGELALVSQEIYKKRVESVPNKIVYKAINEKAVVQMFTDVTCGWCAKVHNNIDDYMTQGITLEVMYFPREGLSSESAKRMSAIAASADPKKWLDSAFKGDYIAGQPVHAVVKDHFIAGQSLGVGGTPSFFVNGYPFEGYLRPEQILAIYTDQ